LILRRMEMGTEAASPAHVESVTSIGYATRQGRDFDCRFADMRSKKVVA
jgi:hypothetical protein